MRISQQQAIESSIRTAQLQQTEIAELQAQLATGLRIRSASDDPAEWNSLSAQKATVARMDVDLQNMSTVRQQLNQSVATLTEAGNILVRAREIALDGMQSQNRETLAQEIDRLIDAMLTTSNAEALGNHLYSGTATHKKAFEVADVDEFGRPIEIVYNGSNDRSETIVAPDNYASVLPSGEDVFQQSARTTTLYVGADTGIRAGEGTDNATGVGSMIVRHTATTYANPIVSPGASSVDGDTIIGPPGAHTLRIEDHPTLGRVAHLNDGGPFAFDAASTDLRVTSESGEFVYVDLSAVPATFTGTIDITAEGTLSSDGGLTETAIDFSSQQVVTNSSDGTVSVVDSTDIRSAGEERVEYSGTLDVFETLIQLRDDLREADSWTTDQLVSVMNARLADVERAHSQVMEFVGEQSVELANLETLETQTREVRLVIQEAVGEIENADVADVIVRLQAHQNQLQFIYASTAQLNQISLLNFI